MWIYVIRRLVVMIPTLFGVTVVAFCIMQLAPGDPLKAQLSATGTIGETSQTREAYLIMRRDLKLDRPLLLNFRYLRDYSAPIREAVAFRGMSAAGIRNELGRLAAAPDAPENAARLAFLRSLDIASFEGLLADPSNHARLASMVATGVLVYLEETGLHGVPAAVAILRDGGSRLEDRIGAIRAIRVMVVEPFQYSYSRDADDAETPYVAAPWRLWWQRAEPRFPALDPDRGTYLAAKFQEMLQQESRRDVLEMLEMLDRDDMRFFVDRLLGDSTLAERVLAAAALNLYIAHPLRLDVPTDASPDVVDEAAENWLAQYELYLDRYEPSLARKLGLLFVDTQYANMVWRLVTFQFGRSATRTREPVGPRILSAVMVSAPLMIIAQIIIYLVAVPLGILCAVNRSNPVDRGVSLALFVLYSIPPFVAGMMFLLFFCYGVFFNWFPSLGLHSPGAEEFGLLHYLLDYLWHAFLPIVCLSLFSLAAMAMYSRTSMLEVIGQDYIRSARAKGLSERAVILKHGLRNALIPIITLFAGFLPGMLGGSVLIEVLFGIPGMGRLSFDSILQRDFPTLMALVYINAIVVMVSILLTDLLYVVADPRISFQGRGQS
ncbi:MAG: ABC transporter permease subunit [Thermoguttaceae bacterium]|jgi:ABC-type dipeptide/oligopeptide/nickel transport system permease component|nr:ABC transporter permease subunit [Thermoguttaceae bacterium]